MPPEDIRRLRTHTRYRRKLTQARTAEKQRAEKLLEDAHLKLSGVISDIHGVSGRDMLAAVIAGERNPKALADLARGVMRRKLAQLEEALDCSFFTPEHAFILQMMLDNIDYHSAQIAVLDERIAALCEPYERQIAQLDAIPGFGVTTAQELIAEIGTDMSAFPTAGHLCSWARVAPRARSPAASARARRPPAAATPISAAALGEASASAGRTRTFLGAKLRRLARHTPKKKAQGAVMRTQLAIAHALLSDPAAEYRELGPGYYERESRHPPPGPRPRPQPGTPRLEGHPRAPRRRRPRNRRDRHPRRQLASPQPTALRAGKPAAQTAAGSKPMLMRGSHFRTRMGQSEAGGLYTKSAKGQAGLAMSPRREGTAAACPLACPLALLGADAPCSSSRSAMSSRT